MHISSPAFSHEGFIPKRFTCEGEDISPALLIEDIPAEAQTLALIVDDPDAPSRTFVHWVVFDMPTAGRIEEGGTPGTQGSNDFGKQNYGGPCPPSGTHRYFFKTFALDTKLGLAEGASKKELEEAMEGHVVAKATLMGRYKKTGI